jgi:hypothetical protein
LPYDDLFDRDPSFTRNFPDGYDPGTGDRRSWVFYAAFRFQGR